MKITQKMKVYLNTTNKKINLWLSVSMLAIITSISYSCQKNKYSNKAFFNTKGDYIGDSIWINGMLAKIAFKDSLYVIEGKNKSSNNAASRADLESGKYNMGKDALQKYGTQPTEQGFNWCFIFIMLLSFFSESCNNQNSNKKAEIKQKRKIIYKLNDKVTSFIKDTIMSDKLCMSITSCSIHYDRNKDIIHIELSYDDGKQSLAQKYILANTSRFLKVGNKLLPIYFYEDGRLGDLPQDTINSLGTLIDDNMDFAILELDGDQNIIKYINFLICNGKVVSKPYYGKQTR